MNDVQHNFPTQPSAISTSSSSSVSCAPTLFSPVRLPFLLFCLLLHLRPPRIPPSLLFYLLHPVSHSRVLSVPMSPFCPIYVLLPLVELNRARFPGMHLAPPLIYHAFNLTWTCTVCASTGRSRRWRSPSGLSDPSMPGVFKARSCHSPRGL